MKYIKMKFITSILFVTIIQTTTPFKVYQTSRNRLCSLSNTPHPNEQTTLLSFFNKGINKVKEGFKNLFIINLAEKKGIPWKEYYNLGATNKVILLQNYNELNNPYIVYPEYYTKSFHLYAEGNLNWEAALEAVPATFLIATNYLRENFTTTIQNHIINYNTDSSFKNTGRIMDIGCSVGASTKHLTEAFPYKEWVDAIDLSPHFLSAAKFHHSTPSSPLFTTLYEKITYHHVMAENMPFESNSYDIVSLSYFIHELPTKITEEVIAEVYRVLRPGGTLAIVDLIGGDMVINKYLFELSEPYIQQYYNTDFIKIISEAGFIFITNENNTRNRIWTASKPDVLLKGPETRAEWEEHFNEIHKFH
jgi:ubiquinone/menaquinone biosynthesis C-methylase UbiE